MDSSADALPMQSAHVPRGSFAVDGIWSEDKYPREFQEKRRLKRFEEIMLKEKDRPNSAVVSRSAQNEKDRPTSAAVSTGAKSLPGGRRKARLSSAPRRRPGTAPGHSRGFTRPDAYAATVFPWKNIEHPRHAVHHTKSAKELREEYIAFKGLGLPIFSEKHMSTKYAENGNLCLTNSEASTEYEDAGSDSDNSELGEGERLDRALRRNQRLLVEASDAASEVERLATENAKHLEEIAGLNHTLESHEERMAYLEDSENLWREKLGKMRDEFQDVRRFMDRARMGKADMEDTTREVLIRSANLAAALNRKERTFECFDAYLSEQHCRATLSLLWQQWQQHMHDARYERLQNLKVTPVVEVHAGPDLAQLELTEQLERQVCQLRGQTETAQLTVSKLQLLSARLASNVLHNFVREPTRRECIVTAWVGWRMVHSAIVLEKSVHGHDKLRQENSSTKNLTDTLQRRLIKAMQDAEQHLVWNERQRMLEADLSLVSRRSDDRLEALETLRRDHAEQTQSFRDELNESCSVRQEMQKELDRWNEQWHGKCEAVEKKILDIKRQFGIELEDWTARVDDLQEAMRPEGASGAARASKPPRVVSRSQGVLCAGCLTQIVHRDVQPIKSLEALPISAQRLENEKAAFFEEVLGQPESNDLVRSWIWSQRKDPFNLMGHRAPVFPDSDGQPESTLSQRTAASSLRPNLAARSANKSAVATMARPKSATCLRRPCRTMPEALREEIPGFRKSWRH